MESEQTVQQGINPLQTNTAWFKLSVIHGAMQALKGHIHQHLQRYNNGNRC